MGNGQLLKGLFINASILVTFLFISGQFFREDVLNHTSALKTRLLGGVIGGILGSALMFFSFQVSSTFILDFRLLALVAVSIYGGLLSSVIAGLIIGSVRLFYFGFSTTSLVGFITALIIAIGCGLISRMRVGEKRKWMYMLAYCLAISLIVCCMLLKDFYMLLKVFIPYGIGMCILTFVMYFCAYYITTSNRVIRRLREEARTDFLTGLNNVRSFDSLFNNAIKVAKQNHESISLLLIDVDFFKKVNDTYGHMAGDAVLKELALLIPKSCRCFDIISRNGGEEFSVILLDCASKRALEIGDRIRKAIGEHSFILPDGKEIHITVSIGVSTYRDTTTDIETLIEQADTALYKAKGSGRNRVCLA